MLGLDEQRPPVRVARALLPAHFNFVGGAALKAGLTRKKRVRAPNKNQHNQPGRMDHRFVVPLRAL